MLSRLLLRILYQTAECPHKRYCLSIMISLRGITMKLKPILLRTAYWKSEIVGCCQNIPLPIYHTLQSIKDWAESIEKGSVQLGDGLYPVAIVNGHVYVTDKIEAISMNGKWVSDSLYCITDTNPKITAKPINIYPPISKTMTMFTIPGSQAILSNELSG